MSRSLPRIAAPALAAALSACAAPAAGPAPVPGPVSPTGTAITAADLRHRMEIVAHDSMQGRDVGTPGIRKAADYLVAEMTRLGLRPAGDGGSWFNAVPLVRMRAEAEVSLGGRTLGADVIVPVSGTGGLPANTRQQAAGRLLYGGWIVDPSVSQAEELTAEQMRGGVLILRMGVAPGAQPGQPRYNVGALLGPGSPLAGVIMIAEGDLEQFWAYAQGIARNGSVAPADSAAPAAGELPTVFLTDPAGAERMIGRPLAQATRPLPDLGAFRYAIRRTSSPIEAFNVVGVLPGADAARRGEYVAIGSHYDHDGIGQPVGGDSIYNGADDDGSGTVAMLEIAERLVRQPPARSVLFVWHTAEEKGLLGSEAFTRTPTVPRESIVAQLNIDMIGRNAPDSLYLVGSRRLSTELGEVVEAVNRTRPRPFAFDYSFDAPNHPERIYCRSDHYNYARYGIPVTFFTTGLHDQYHKPQDEAHLIDYDKLARVTQLIADIGVEVANHPARPRVDKPVPPLGTPCT
ncbi:M28 family metallopeptidase [Longimicrobium sp.]|uniref:M28 family metallopeptidase n=1 Tax=Longimicrobium sp. TaxID=2029185 RepID=UPI002F91EED5